MTKELLTKKALLKLEPKELSVEQTLISQDLSVSLGEVSQYIDVIKKQAFAVAEFEMPVPKITKDLITITDTFTQAVCNTYRVEIKPLLKTIPTKELQKN
jgi:hypothetical protein